MEQLDHISWGFRGGTSASVGFELGCVSQFGDCGATVFSQVRFTKGETRIVVILGDEHHLTIFYSCFESFSAVISVEARLVLVTGFPVLSAITAGLSGAVSAN